jgi:N6-adenosine-specific RNA methylase IME4
MSDSEMIVNLHPVVGLPTGPFRCIVADPPWPIGNFPAWFNKDRQSKRERTIGMNPTPYKTMTLQDIENLPVGDSAADGAHLYLWTTDAFYEAALSVARSWGFEKSATLVWCKAPMGKGMGGVYPSNVEFALFCRKIRNPEWAEIGAWIKARRIEKNLTTAQVCSALGAHGAVNHGGMQSNWENGLALPTNDQWEKLELLLGFKRDREAEQMKVRATRAAMPKSGRADSRWNLWPRGRHSAKPEAFQDMVESVSPGPYLEMFARRPRLGWTVWGNEVPCKANPELTHDREKGTT